MSENKVKILFVCLGNICRSPMAEMIMKKMVKDAGREEEFEISSAATSDEVIGYDIYPPAKECLRKHDIPFQKRGARQVTDEDYSYYDHIFVMDWANLRDMKQRFGVESGELILSTEGQEWDAINEENNQLRLTFFSWERLAKS